MSTTAFLVVRLNHRLCPMAIRGPSTRFRPVGGFLSYIMSSSFTFLHASTSLTNWNNHLITCGWPGLTASPIQLFNSGRTKLKYVCMFMDIHCILSLSLSFFLPSLCCELVHIPTPCSLVVQEELGVVPTIRKMSPPSFDSDAQPEGATPRIPLFVCLGASSLVQTKNSCKAATDKRHMQHSRHTTAILPGL